MTNKTPPPKRWPIADMSHVGPCPPPFRTVRPGPSATPRPKEHIVIDLRVQPDVVGLFRERDELLVALKDLVSQIEPSDPAILPARALIARCEKP